MCARCKRLAFMTALNRTLLLLLVGLGAGWLPGCSVCKYAQITSYEEPKVFSRKRDRRASLAVYRSLADEALATSGAACPEGCVHADFQWGFREGFAQYVYAGGDGSPPPVPPRAYWQVDMRTPEGAAAVQSWFEGYRVGAQVARVGGYRDAATVKVSASVRDCTPCGCPDQAGAAATGAACCPAAPPTTPPPTVGQPLEQIQLPKLTQPELVPPASAKPAPQQPSLLLPAPEGPQPLASKAASRSLPPTDKTDPVAYLDLHRATLLAGSVEATPPKPTRHATEPASFSEAPPRRLPKPREPPRPELAANVPDKPTRHDSTAKTPSPPPQRERTKRPAPPAQPTPPALHPLSDLFSR